MNIRLHHIAAASFEAARRLPGRGGPGSLHGHGFRVRVAGASATADALGMRLRQSVAPLNYAFLNEQIAQPTDEAVARRLHAAMNMTGLAGLSLRSAPDRGIDLDAGGVAHEWQCFRFEAAHRLPNVPPGHKCGRLHGHGFEVTLHRRSDGGAADEMEHAWALLAPQLDGACLNDLPGLDNPTSELIAYWIWQRVHGALPELSRVSVFETRSSGCHFDGVFYRIWKSKHFESAVPVTSAAASLCGHSYWLRLHLYGDLDKVLGWVRDFGDVKERLQPAYRQLDHHRLDRLDGRPATDLAGLLGWLEARLSPQLPELARIDLFETPARGAALCRGGGELDFPL